MYIRIGLLHKWHTRMKKVQYELNELTCKPTQFEWISTISYNLQLKWTGVALMAFSTADDYCNAFICRSWNALITFDPRTLAIRGLPNSRSHPKSFNIFFRHIYSCKKLFLLICRFYITLTFLNYTLRFALSHSRLLLQLS